MAALNVYLFRDFAIRDTGEVVPDLEAKKARELLSYLLLNPARPHRRQLLMTLLWEDSDDVRAQKYLRQTLWQLQSGLDSFFPTETQRLLQVDADWVQINPTASIWCDATEFSRVFQVTKGTAGSELNAAQAAMLEQAIALYRGDLLENWYQNWCLIEREHLHNVFLIMLDKLIDCCEAHRRYEDGIAYGMQALKQDYARERTHRRLMRLFSLSGDRTGAIRQYEHCAAVLRQELDVAPSQRTQQLFELIRGDKLATENAGAARPAAVPASGSLVDHLLHLHANLGEIQSLIQHEIDVARQYYSPH